MIAIGGRPRSRNAILALLIIFLIALTLRLLFVHFTKITPFPGQDDGRYLRHANDLLAGQGFVTRKGVPTAYTPPGYPVFLAGVKASLGQHAIFYVQAVLGALTCVLAFLICDRLFNPRAAAVLAGLLLAISPTSIVYTGMALSEVLATFLMTGALFVLVAANRVPGRGWRSSLFFYGSAGLLLGMSILVRPAVLAYSFGVILCLLLLQAGSHPQRLLAALALLFGILAAISPWTYRNYEQFHALVPLDSNGGYNLLLGNNPRAYGGGWMHLKAADDLRRADEIEGSRKARQRAFEWISKHPLAYAKVTAHRTLNWLLPVPDYVSLVRLTSTPDVDAAIVKVYRTADPVDAVPFATAVLQKSEHFNRRVLTLWFLITIPLALAGILWNLLYKPTWLLLLPLATYAGILSLTFMQPRFREITTPIFLIYAAVGLSGVAQWLTAWRRRFSSFIGRESS